MKASRFRWVVVVVLLGISIVSYIERVNMSVAGELIMKEFDLSPTQMGTVFGAFLISYTIFQFPAGQLADRYGSRLVLTLSAWGWVVCTVLSALVPGAIVKSTLGVLVTLWGIRFLLGIVEAPTYPAAGRAVSRWLADSERGFANAIVLTGAALGSAVSAPLISRLMVDLGWRSSLLIMAFPAVVIAIVWWWVFTDLPANHPLVNGSELEIIHPEHKRESLHPAAKMAWVSLLKNESFWSLCGSYLLHSYVTYIFVFWFYIYLVEVRGFTLARGGIFTTAPFLVATVLSPAGGALCDLASRRFGFLWGRRAVPCFVLPSAALLVFYACRAVNPYLAVVLFSLAAGLAWAAEGPFWASMTDIAGPFAGSAGGMLNMVGNIGGTLSAILTPWIAEQIGWVNVFTIASVMGLLGALLWLFVNTERGVAEGAAVLTGGIT